MLRWDVLDDFVFSRSVAGVEIQGRLARRHPLLSTE
jgi:hypothetical protein